MKFDINATAPTIFSEQLSNVIDLFQQWNDCERAVMLFAVLRKVPFPITKLLQSGIDTSLQQAQYEEKAKTLERNANCAKYINSLSETYNRYTTDSICFASDRSIDNIDKYYGKKEDILRDILKMMPILTVGNDEARLAYLEFIPMTVRDATRRIVSSTLVQQLFSYVLIHPAFTTEDRGSVFKYLKDLEAHISSNEPNFFLYRNGSSPTSEPTNPSTPSNWQAIAPPQSKSTETIPSSPWSSGHYLTPRYADDNDYHRNQPAPISKLPSYERNSDCHMPFEKNGQIINETDDANTNTFNTPLGFHTLPAVTKHIVVDGCTLKKRRQSFTGPTHSPLATPLAVENANEKKRSFSLPVINIDASFHISKLVESKQPLFQSPQPQNHNVGMRNIAQWLKSLRLHKYVFLFTHQTYEQMLDTTEDQLSDVTQGARHKLVNCIRKLKERHAVLLQVEKDWLCGQVTMAKALEELSNIVLTPMKPMDPHNPQDVASQFLKVLNLVSTEMTAKLHIVPQDEEYVNSLMWILEKAGHSEAFVAHTNLLRDHRYNVQRIKNHFPSKSHYPKNSATRQRTLEAFLPSKGSPAFTPINRPISRVLPFSTFAKYQPPTFHGPASLQPLPPLQPVDQHLFKIPPIPTLPATPRQRTDSCGSVKSIASVTSSGYHSDGFPIGMGNIRKWLKSLRLHKYTWVFDNVSYEQMFTFTEEYLLGLNITQGASHKLAICIDKLKTRAETMQRVELSLSQNRMFVAEAIYEMESMVLSPMKPFRFNCDTDVGYQLWKVLNLVFNLLSSNNYDEPTVQSFQRIVETSMNSEAFQDSKYQLNEMRMKLARLGRRMIR